MTTMDTTSPLDQFSPEEKAITRRVYSTWKAGGDLSVFTPEEKATTRRVYSAWKGAPAPAPTPNIAAQFAQPHEGVFPFPGGATPPDLADRRELLARGYNAAFTAPIEDIQARTVRNMAPGPDAVSLPDGPLPGMNAQAIAAQEYEDQYPTPGGAAGRFLHGVVNAPMNLGGAIITGATGPIQAAARAAGMPDVASAVGRSVDQGRAVFEPRGTAGQIGNVVGNAALLGVGSAAGLPASVPLGTFAAQGAGAGMEDYRRSVPADQYSTLAATGVGAAQGVVAGAGGVVGLGPIIQRYGPGGAVGHVAGILRAAGVGAADNVAMQMVNNAIANTYTDRDLTAGVGEAALAGTVFGGVAHATGPRLANLPGSRQDGAAEGAGPSLRPGETTVPTAPTPDQAQARAAQPPPAVETPKPARQPAATETTNPAAVELPREVPQEGQPQGRQEGLLSQPVPASPEAPAPGTGGPIRSGDTLPPGSRVTNRDGAEFVVGPTLANGKVVLTTPEGRTVQRTAGEMEARGWKRVRQEPGGHRPEPFGTAESSPARDASTSDSGPSLGSLARTESPISRPATRQSGAVSSPDSTQSGRVGPPPEEVANPRGMPKGEKQPWEMTLEEARAAVQPNTRDELNAARPILKSMYPEEVQDAHDAWGIRRAVERGDELPRVPMVDFTRRHRAAVQTAISEGRPVPPEVLKDYPELAPRPEKSPPATPEVAAEPAPPEPNQPGFLDAVIAKAEKRKAGRKKAKPAPDPTPEPESGGPSRVERARSVIRMGARSPYAEEFGSIAGAKRAIAEEAKAAAPAEKPADAPTEKPKPEGVEALWSMTKAEFRALNESQGVRKDNVASETAYRKAVRSMNKTHRELVEMALSEGRAVPPEVLADYPDLIRSLPPSRRPARTDQIGSSTPQETKPAPKSDPFLDDMPAMQRGRTEKALAANVTNRGRVVSRRDLVNEKVRDGASVVTAKNGERRLTTPDGSYLDEKAIGKTAMDYAEFLSRPTQPAPAPSRLESAADATIAAAEARKAERRKALAEARRKLRPNERLGTNILPDIVDDVIIVAAKAVKKGARTVSEVKAIVKDHLGYDSPDVLRRAYRLIKDSTGADGKHDDARFEVAADELRQRAQDSSKVQQGLADQNAREKMSAVGEKAKAALQAKREEFADTLDTLRAKEAIGHDIRDELASFAKSMLDPMDHRKVLSLIAKSRAKNPTADAPDMKRDLVAGISRMLEIRNDSAAKKARAALLGTVGGPARPKSNPKLAAAINRRIGVLPEKSDLAGGIIDPRKLLPDNRDAAAPIVEAIKKGFTRKDLVESLASHLEDKAGRLGSGWVDDAKMAALRAIGTKATKNLTADEAVILRESLEHLQHLNNVERTAVVGGKEVDRQKLHADIRDQVEARYAKDMTPDNEVGGIRLTLRQIRRTLGESFRGFGHLTGTAFGEESAAHDLIYKNAHRAESKHLASSEEAKDAIRKVAIAEKVDNAALERMRTKKEKVKLPGGSIMEMTPADRMLLVARYSDPQNRELMLANGVKHERYDGVKGHEEILAPADYDAIEASMSPAEKAILAEFKKQTNGRLRDEMNAASVRIDGYEIATNPDHVSRAVDSYGRDRNRKDQTFTLRRWLEDMGILKERTKHNRAILYGDFFAFADRHIDQMTRYAHMAEPIRDALIALGDPETRSVLIRKFGRQFISNLEDHFEYVSGTGRHMTSPDQSLMRKFTGAAGTAILAARPTSAALQNLGFLTASVDGANAGEAARIARHVADVRWADDAAYDDLIKHSGALRVRHEHGATRLIDFTRGEQETGIGSRVTDGAIAAALHPLSARDRFVSTTVFKEVRETVKAENPSWTPDKVNEEAAIRTEQIIGRTQNPSQRMDRSRMDREADTNAMKAAWLMFTSAGVRAGNLVQSKVYEAVKNPTRQTKARAAWAIAATVVSSAVAELIREQWRKAKHGFQDEQFPRDAGAHGTNITADLANNYLPGAGDVVRGVVAKLRGRPMFKDNGGLTETAVSAFGKLTDLGEYLLTDDDSRREKALGRLKQSGSVLAPLDLVRGASEAIAGPEPAGWSIAAALKRNDYKTALARARKLAALKLQATKDGEPVDPETVKQSIAASVLARLNKGLKKGPDDDAMADNAATARDLAADAMP